MPLSPDYATTEEYEKELMQFMSVLHDLILAGAHLSGRTIDYILRHTERLGKPINNFPVEHPVFPYIAASSSITHKFALEVMRLSDNSGKVRDALAHNDVLSETERTMFALHSHV